MIAILFNLSEKIGYYAFYCLRWFFLLTAFIATDVISATYNLSGGSYPPCNETWSVSGTTYTCGGGGVVTLANGDLLTSTAAITIVANGGFNLNNNTIGTVSNNITLSTTTGNFSTSGTNTLNGSITSSGGVVTLSNTSVTGTITANGNINLTNGTVNGLVRSTSNSITTSGTHLLGGAMAHSGITVTGGTLTGAFSLTSNNLITLTGVNLTSGSITGSDTINLINSTIGSSGSSITISTTSNNINVNNSTVFGNLTAPNYATVNVTNGGSVTGTCTPNSTPANACNATPATCTTGLLGGLTGSYFSNKTLTAPATGTRTDYSINFDWGTSTPGVSGISANNFSVRWTGSLRAPTTGNYQFQTQSDDGVRLWVNNVQVINNWTDHSLTTNTSANLSLVAGQSYPITLEYYESTGSSVMKLLWSQPNFATFSPISTEAATPFNTNSFCTISASTCPNGGLLGGASGKYYNNTSLTAPIEATRIDPSIDFNWGYGAPGVAGVGSDYFSVRWDGTIKTTTAGSYQFETVSDDGVRLWVNNQQIINNWTPHSLTSNTGTITLSANTTYAIRLEFYDDAEDAIIGLRWKPPSSSALAAINTCPSVLTSYVVTVSSTGITCAGEPVTIGALDNLGATMTPLVGTNITLTTNPSTGTWAGGNTASFNGSSATLVKHLQQTTPSALTINVTDGTSTGTGSITFVDSALKFYGTAAGAAMPNQVAGTTDNNPVLKAIRTDNDSGACVAQVQGVKNVKLAYECVNPTSCVAGETMSLAGTGVQANANGAATVYTTKSLTFDNTGTASIPLNYSDVGQVKLHAQLDLAASGNDPAKTLSNTSNTFVVRPSDLTITAVQTTGGVANPATTNTGAGFSPSGKAFKVTVEAHDSAGGITPNFGRETTPVAIELQLNSLVHPAGGTLGALTLADAFVASSTLGRFDNTTVSWNEAGTIALKAHIKSNDYLSTGDVISATAVNAGRFYPDHFYLNNAAVTNSCSGSSFNYMGQPSIGLTYDLRARNWNGATVTNYNANYSATLATPVYYAENADNGVDLSSRLGILPTVIASNWSAGKLDFVASSAVFNRQATTLPDGPFNTVQLGIAVSDTLDNRQIQTITLDMNAATAGSCTGSCTAKTLNTVPLNLRYGRLRLDDAFGPETVRLPVNFATEYWTGNYFALNASDSCTLIPRSAITYPNGTLANDANRTINLSSGTTQGMYNNLNLSGVQFNGGTANHYFSAPSAAGTGSFIVGIDLTNLSWLRFDWNQDGNYSDTSLPNARFSFGSYRGNDRIIYWREKLQ